MPRAPGQPAGQAPQQAPAGAAQHHHRGQQAARLLHLGPRHGPGRLCAPHRGGEAPPPDPPGRRVQHAVHLRHHRLPQGGHAHPLQRGEQRQGHRRLHGPFHRGQADDPGAHVPLLRHGAGHDRRYDPRHHHVPHHRLLPQKGPGLHQ